MGIAGAVAMKVRKRCSEEDCCYLGEGGVGGAGISYCMDGMGESRTVNLERETEIGGRENRGKFMCQSAVATQ